MLRHVLLLTLVALACGKRYTSRSGWDGRIVGGVDTTIEKHPYQVSLQYITSHMCGASILNNNTIITAAHCVHGFRPNSLTILVGTTYLNVSIPSNRYFISKIIAHEGYNTTNQDNDIALLKTNRLIQFSDKVQPIALPESGQVVPALAPAVVTGWGATEEGGHSIKNLKEATVTAMHINTCVGRYGSRITKHMMCCQSPGKDSCQGDSGGPLVWKKTLVGIVSWGFGCARPEYPGVYTDVATERSWIDANIN